MEKRLRKKEKKRTIKGRSDGLLKKIEGDPKVGRRTLLLILPFLARGEV